MDVEGKRVRIVNYSKRFNDVEGKVERIEGNVVALRDDNSYLWLTKLQNVEVLDDA